MEKMEKFLNNGKFALRFPLNIQLFADGDGDGGEGGDGGSDDEITISKKQYDKNMSEISRLKKELKAKMTDEEKFNIAQKEKDDQIKELTDFKTKSTLTSGLIESFGKESAEKIADAIIEGDPSKIAEIVAKSYETAIKGLQDEISQLKLAAMDKPGDGDNSGGKEPTLEDFNKMTIDEQIALKIKNPELFKTLMNSKA